MKQKQHFVLAQNACAEFYPPLLNQAALLAKYGQVTLLDTSADNAPSLSQNMPGVRRARVAGRKVPRRLPLAALSASLQSVWRFSKAFGRQMAKRPRAVIAYEPEAAFFLLRSRRYAKHIQRIVHLHELPDEEVYRQSRVGSFALRYLLRHLHRADLVVMPDRHRAQWVQQKCGLRELPMVVMNCPRRLETLPASRLLPWLRERGVSTDKIVHYQGAVGADHNFERLIESMQFWPDDAVFVIVGSGPENYVEQLRSLARDKGVKDRVLFTGRVSYDEVFSYAVGASVGVSFLNAQYTQWELSAGASNKRFEYVALGIPQVTNSLPGVQELFEQPGVATTAPYDDAEAIGKAIGKWFGDDALCAEVFHKARALHLDEYNYEQQMQPLLDKIL